LYLASPKILFFLAGVGAPSAEGAMFVRESSDTPEKKRKKNRRPLPFRAARSPPLPPIRHGGANFLLKGVVPALHRFFDVDPTLADRAFMDRPAKNHKTKGSLRAVAQFRSAGSFSLALCDD